MFGCITFHPQTLCWRSGKQQQICQVWVWTCHRCTSGSYCASIIYVLRTKVEQWGCDNQQQDSGYHHKKTLPQNVNVGCEIWWTNTPSHKFAVSRVRKCKWSVQDKHVATSELFIHLPARSAATPLWHLGCFSMSVTVFTCHICSMVASCNLQHATVWFQAEHQCLCCHLCCHLCSDGRGFSCEKSMPLITCVEVPMLWLPACSQSIRHEFQGTLAGERRKQSCVFMHMCIHNFQGCDTKHITNSVVKL